MNPSPPRADAWLPAKIAAARVYQWVGLAGLIGLTLIALSAAVAIGRARHAPTEPVEAAPAPLPARNATAPQVPLPPASEVPLLLTQLEQAATAQGLPWSQAQYRLQPAAEDLPASLELRLGFKAPYLAVRRFTAIALRDVPGTTLREFAISRPSSDTAQVEAKLAFTIFLAGDAGPAARSEAVR